MCSILKFLAEYPVCRPRSIQDRSLYQLVGTAMKGRVPLTHVLDRYHFSSRDLNRLVNNSKTPTYLSLESNNDSLATEV